MPTRQPVDHSLAADPTADLCLDRWYRQLPAYDRRDLGVSLLDRARQLDRPRRARLLVAWDRAMTAGAGDSRTLAAIYTTIA